MMENTNNCFYFLFPNYIITEQQVLTSHSVNLQCMMLTFLSFAKERGGWVTEHYSHHTVHP